MIDAVKATQKEAEEARKTEEQRQKEAKEREGRPQKKRRDWEREIQSTIKEDEHHKDDDELSKEECKLGIWDKYKRDDYDSK